MVVSSRCFFLRPILVEGRPRCEYLAKLASALLAHQPRLVALPVLRLLGLALVGFLLALGEADLAFGDAALVEIDPKRHHRHAVTADRAEQLAELAVVKQQLACPARLVIEPRRLVFRDMRVDEIERAVALGGRG